MKMADILPMRLDRHGLARIAFKKPEDVVGWFGAVQAQDYLGSLWAIGLRTRGGSEPVVEDAERRRAIVRLWPMRGTLHFVAAADARWMTRLLAPRVMARNAARWEREFGVDARLVARADEILTAALEGGKRLPRDHIYECLEARRVRTSGSRGLHILLCLAMRGRLCLAGRQGKQHTFALLDEWIPGARELEGKDAWAELARRYFTSHGPASLKDFMWWAGITAKDAAAAVALAAPKLESATADDVQYWWGGDMRRAPRTRAPLVQLLPAYDEYAVAYQDRSLLVDGRAAVSKMALLSPAVLVDGRIAGSWKRVLARDRVTIMTAMSRKLSREETASLRDAARGYGEFVGLEASIAR